MGQCVYYFLDDSGNGSADGTDWLGHDPLDDLLNDGLDTVNTQTSGAGAVKGVDDARTVTVGGYTLVLPTLNELTALYSSPLPNPPKGWIDHAYWSATLASPDSHKRVFLGGGSENTILDSDNHYATYVAFQVL